MPAANTVEPAVEPVALREAEQPAAPVAERPRARVGSINYAVRAPLLAWLDREANRAAESYGSYRVLDVGCGIKPYFPIFAAHADTYTGVDVANSGADVIGSADEIPVADGTYDVVLC